MDDDWVDEGEDWIDHPPRPQPPRVFGLDPTVDAYEHPNPRGLDLDHHPNEPTQERVLELRAMPYERYLGTEEWWHRRRHILHRAEARCEQCGSRSGSLQVHHLTYERLGYEHDDDLVALCASCHRDIHGR